MTDRPIMFSGPMVRALIDGRKTQTRRIIKKKSALDAIAVFGADFLKKPGCADLIPYAISDRLWVRESFVPHYYDDLSACYKADWKKEIEDVCPRPKFKPAIHMPRWASRLTLAVTDVRIQPLQDIGWDYQQEGIETILSCGQTYYNYGNGNFRAEKDGETVNPFKMLWDSLHGQNPGESWDDNPFIVALTFTVHHCNIDKMVQT